MAKLKENSTIVKASGEELIATEPMVLSMIQENAYVHPATHPASMITGLAPVAISGDYNDLINKPNLEPPQPVSPNPDEILYTDKGSDPEWAGVKYRLVMINGEAFMEVVESE